MQNVDIVNVTYVRSSGVEKGGAGGRSPRTLQMFLEIRAYKNHYSVVEGYFRLKAVEKPLFHKI